MSGRWRPWDAAAPRELPYLVPANSLGAVRVAR